MVLALALVGWALSRLRLAPLGPAAWTLLLVGAATAHITAALVLVGCFLALGWRRRAPPSGRAWAYDLGQIAAVTVTVVAAATLFAVVKEGLLSRPDMNIAGNGSDPGRLAFYQDRSGPSLPRALVVSTPLFVYRAIMLAWSLWLATATIGWARWVWAGLKEHGLWRPLRSKPAPAPPGPP
jgi:hypothetical protein